MTEPRISRRAALAAAASTLPLASAAAAFAQPAEKPRPALALGIATTGFREHTNERLAKELAAEGVRVVQLFLSQSDSNYWTYNGRNDLSDLSEQRCREIAGAYRAVGIAIHSLGVYTNLIHPDPDERKANLAYFEAMMRVGAWMNVRTFITEAGHYHDPAPGVEYHYREEVWKRMIATGKELARLAERYDAVVLFEPFYRHFLASAKRTRVYLEELGSPRLRALLDPANLLELNDLEEMFEQLAPWIDCLHAKDRKLHVDGGVPAGQGDVDYPKFVRLCAERTPGAPLILEYVGAGDYKPALEHLRRVIGEAGLTWS